MSSTTNPPSLRDESGFTLVELLVAMTLSLVILFGILLTLDQFTSNAARQSRVTDANDQVRKAMDRVVSDLRQAATITFADADDLVYTVPATATTTRYERICVDSANRLWRSSTSTVVTGGGTCPSAGANRITPLLVANSATLFRYDNTIASKVRSVTLTVALNAGNSGRTDVSTLSASAFRRAESEKPLPVTNGSISTSCNPATKVPTLTLAASVGTATVTYTDTEGNTLGSGSAGSNVTLSSATPTATTVIANITSSAGLVSHLVQILECPS